MVTVSEKIFIAAVPERVFKAAGDPSQQVIWDKNNFKDPVALNHPEPGLGARYTCWVAGMGKMTYEFTQYKPFSLFEHASETQIASGRHLFEFSEEGSGTIFLQTMNLKPHGWGYLLYPFMKMLTRSRLRKMNKNLKCYVENQ